MKQLIIILFLNVFSSHSQYVFQKSFLTAYPDQINEMLHVNDSLIILGESYSNLDPTNKRILLMQSELNGDTTWAHYYGVTGKELNSTSVKKGTGNYGISGVIFEANTSPSADGLFIVTDSIGNWLTAISFGGTDQDRMNDLAKDTDSTFIAIGASNSFFVGSYTSIYGLKLSSTGDTIWTKAYGGTNLDYAYSICNTSDNMYAITGSTTSFGSLVDWSAFLMKIDTDGNVLWHKSYNEFGVDLFPRKVMETADGGFIISGHREGLTNQDAYIIKTDMLGELEWSRAIGDMGFESVYQAVETINGDFIMTGDFINPFIDSIGFGSFDALILKLNNLGNLEFSKVYGNEKSNFGQTIISDNYGMYYVGGTTINRNDTISAYNSDGYLIKTDSNGVSACNQMTISFTSWEPSIDVASNSITSIPTSTNVTSLIISTGGTITDDVFCEGQVGLTDLTTEPKQLIRIVDLIGRESVDKPNTILIHIYSDGTTKKVYRME